MIREYFLLCNFLILLLFSKHLTSFKCSRLSGL